MSKVIKVKRREPEYKAYQFTGENYDEFTRQFGARSGSLSARHAEIAGQHLNAFWVEFTNGDHALIDRGDWLVYDTVHGSKAELIPDSEFKQRYLIPRGRDNK